MGTAETHIIGLATPQSASRHQVRLLGDFTVRADGRDVRLSADAQRLVAFLALRRSTVKRTTVAGNLWTDSTQDRAYGNLRSALWRVQQATRGLIETAGPSLRIANAVETDVDVLVERHTKVDGPDAPDEQTAWPYRAECLLFSQELLADWHDEWVLVERERMRQVSLHLLERLSGRLVAEERYPAAMEAALAAIRLDPLRESAHRCVVRVHLAEGNYSDAIRHVDGYTVLLQAEVGINPSPHLASLLRAYDIVRPAGTASTSGPSGIRPRAEPLAHCRPAFT
jgi:DNA-binding SARP family transcriptional activator